MRSTSAVRRSPTCAARSAIGGQRSHKFLKHIGLYAYKSSVLRRIAELPQGTLEKLESLEQLRWLENGFRIKAAETHSESLAIDTPDDLKAAVEFLRRSEK